MMTIGFAGGKRRFAALKRWQRPEQPGTVAAKRQRPPWGEAVLMTRIAELAGQAPDKVACLFPDAGTTLTYGALHRRATRAAHWLIGLGLQGGDCFALLLDNCAAVFELAFAAERAGLYYVPISTYLRPAEVGYILRDCGAKVLVTTAAMLDGLQPPPGMLVATVDACPPGTIDYDAALAAQPMGPLPPRPVGRDVLYSSGTTGQPKGVFRPMLPAAPSEPQPDTGVMAAFGADAATVYLSTGPLYHAAPHRFTLQTLRRGGTCIVPRRFDAEAALAAIERHRVTHSQWVPTMFVRLLALPEAVRARYDLSSMRRVIHAAAPCPVAVKERMITWWGPIIFEYYAGSESIGATAIESDDWLTHKGSVGRAIAGTVHITDEAGRELPPGEVGAIWFAGLPAFEYLNAPEKTRAAVNARGWATYGDIGHLDPDGYLYLSDRRADLIISGGVNIYPQEVENVLARHPAIADAAVIGIPNPDLGERVQGVVQLREGAQAGPAELMAFCREHLAGPKCPRGIDIVDHLPRSDIGKLLRRVLREQYRAVAAGRM